MNIYDQIEMTIKRDFYVVKANCLIQRSRYDLSLAEQRAIAYICSMIKPVEPSLETMNAPYQLDYSFTIQEYAKVCGLSISGKFYLETKELFKKLMMRIIHLELVGGSDLMLSWLDRVYISISGLIKIRINAEMSPFIFDLKENFTSYTLLNILAMKSQYSIRIYELLRSYAYRKIINFEIEELKETLMVECKSTYDRYPDFRRKLLDPSIAEINKYTDLQVSYETITKGRKVVKIKFFISKKDPFDRFKAQAKANEEITTT